MTKIKFNITPKITYKCSPNMEITMTKKVALPKIASKTAETNYPYIYKVECDGDDGVRVFLFKSVHRTENNFKVNVKRAIKDWIDCNPEDFAEAVADLGMNDLDVQPGERGFKSAAKKATVTWEMVVKAMPVEVALRHGFTGIISTTIWVDDEYENIAR
jgi:hypothetical protein